MVFCFFFNDTATTEIYTYGHTLALHDALPILRRSACTEDPRGERHDHEQETSVRGPLHNKVGPPRAGRGATDTRLGDTEKKRSEGHTSELQSLMRISYAVFCLKKKKNKKHKTATAQKQKKANSIA